MDDIFDFVMEYILTPFMCVILVGFVFMCIVGVFMIPSCIKHEKELEETKRRIQIYDEHNRKNFELFNQVSKTAQEMDKRLSRTFSQLVEANAIINKYCQKVKQAGEYFDKWG